MSKTALTELTKLYTPCDKCESKVILRDYDEDGIVLYCYRCAKRFYPEKELIKKIAKKYDGTN